MGGVQVVGGEYGIREMRVQSMGEMGKTFVQTFSNRFLKTLTEGAVTTDAGSLFQCFTTLTENAGQPEVVAAAVSLQRSALYLNDQQCKCLAVAIIRADGRTHRPKTFLKY